MNITTKWLLDGVEVRELEVLLREYFGGCMYADNKLSFWRDGKVVAEMMFSKAGRLLSIQSAPELASDEIGGIAQKIKDNLLTKDLPVWGGAKLFATHHVNGFYRYKDLFQIVPVPQSAPKADGIGSVHPGIIEVKEVGSPDVLIRSMRCSSTTRRIELFLSWLVPGIRHFEYTNGPETWVYGDIIDGQITSELRHQGYAFPNERRVDGDFSDVSALTPLESLKFEDFYGRPLAIHPSKGLQIPDNLTQLLESIFSLQEDKHARLTRSCFWLQSANKIHRDSKSSSYVALVSAIEALLPAQSEEKCPCCGKPKGPGPTALFREFIETYLPGIPQSERSEFYNLRSSLTHGSSTLIDDLEIWNGTRRSMGEGSKFMRLNQIVRLSILNWLEAVSGARFGSDGAGSPQP